MADGRNGGPPPRMPYWHVYTDAEGVSRQERFDLAAFKFEGIDANTAPQWNDKQEPSKAGVTFTVLPVGWVGQWHENPRPQWIAILSGRWFVETMDGTRVEMGPGELMMGEDQNTKAHDGKKGHLSGTVGTEPCTMIVTGLDVTPTVNQPGRFKLEARMDGLAFTEARFKSFVLPNAPLEKLGEGFRWCEGPVWFGDRQELLFSDLPNDRVMCWSESGGVSVFRSGTGFENGHARDRQGRLLSCSHRDRRITRTELDGTITVLADRFEGRRLNSPNDIVCKSDGTIWFTDPPYGIQTDYEGGKQGSELPANVYRFDPRDGSLRIAAGDFDGPNGLAFSPDERRLYIAESGLQFAEAPKRHIRVFDVAEDGSLSGGDVFHTIEPGFADGFRLDDEGYLWSSAGDGVHCIDPHGALVGKILVPSTVSNLAFGGRNDSRLFLCASHALYAIYTNRRGARLL